jgi:hypothetical protein
MDRRANEEKAYISFLSFGIVQHVRWPDDAMFYQVHHPEVIKDSHHYYFRPKRLVLFEVRFLM